MSNTASGGYLKPHPQPPALQSAPPGLTFIQFLQGVLVGLSGIDGTLVRPDWQQQPPKQPDIGVNWLAYGMGSATPDNNAFVGYDSANNPIVQRNELIPIQVSMYGPQAYDNLGMLRDAFQLTQNLAALRTAKVGFAYDTPMNHVPDFFNERWYERWTCEFYLRRLIQRVYPILSFVSASGTIYTQTANNTNAQLPWAAGG